MGIRLCNAIWHEFCGLQKWFEKTPKVVCKVVYKLSQKILNFIYSMFPMIKNVMKHINQD